MAITPTLKSCFGSTVDEFAQSAGSVFGDGVFGRTTFALAKDFESTNKKLTKATLSLTITSATAHWAGPGLRDGKHAPQPDATNKDAIARIEALNKAHEQRHIDGDQSVFDSKKSEIEKNMIGKTKEEFEAAFADLNKALKAACEELHKTEGLIVWTFQNGAYSIVVKPQGSGGCD
jgi:hypothetical protein